MAERRMVPFEGADSGTAELTWGQRHIWTWIRESGTPLSMSATRTLAADATIDQFVDELRFYMCRFQAMRTRLRFDADGRVAQVVAGSGEVPLDIVDAADDDPVKVAEAVAADHKGSHFDYANEWPVRMTLVRRKGVLTHLVMTLCHVVVDSAAAIVMFMDLLARDASTGMPHGPVAAPGPLELAAWQGSPAGRRQSDIALRHWEQQLRAIPPSRRTGAPRRVDDVHDGVRPARYWKYDCESPVMQLALRRVAARLGADTTPVLLALYAQAVARVLGQRPVVFMVFASNRFRPGLAEAVSPVNQAGLFVLDPLDLDEPSFDGLVDRVRRRAMATYKYAYYSQTERDELIERVGRDRGAAIDLGCWVNDRRTRTALDPDQPRPTAEEIDAATVRTAVRRTPLDLFIKRLMLTIDDGDDAVRYVVEADTEFISIDELESLVRELDALAVEAAG